MDKNVMLELKYHDLIVGNIILMEF